MLSHRTGRYALPSRTQSGFVVAEGAGLTLGPALMGCGSIDAGDRDRSGQPYGSLAVVACLAAETDSGEEEPAGGPG